MWQMRQFLFHLLSHVLELFTQESLTIPPSPAEFNRAPRIVTLPSPTVYGLEDAQEGEAGKFLSSFR